jgi:hypothetical protein
MVFMPKDGHPLSDNRIRVMIAPISNLTLIFCRKLAMIHGRLIRIQ